MNLTRSNIGKQINNQSPLLVFDTTQITSKANFSNPAPGDPCVMAGMVVRRLTPLECERLMGLRDGYTLITYRGKPAKDGSRYKALGNSMVRDVMLWIGRRIELRLAA